jgi:hypothetical protein
MALDPCKPLERRDYEAYTEDCNGKTARLVSDECNGAKLDQMITLLGNMNGGGGGGVSQILSRVPFTVASGQENTWLSVPVIGMSLIADVNVFDASDYEELFIDIRLLNNSSELEIRSKKSLTYTVHVEGYA